ncbi:Pentapeptide_repeats-containing protein [Hexamita inflata]|uniref:Pentapeptide repeats-containing protein n=1 Tax=Hexamita inflata TaxID=28002 RepID=A0AA86PE24_9EUKA|nr:Pentapeptide repeats-containing protein [Hexamita inflata]
MGCAAAKSLPQVNQYSSSDQKFLNLVMKYQESVKQDNDKYEEARDMLYGAVYTNNINCRSDSIEVVNMLLKFITAETIIDNEPSKQLEILDITHLMFLQVYFLMKENNDILQSQIRDKWLSLLKLVEAKVKNLTELQFKLNCMKAAVHILFEVKNVFLDKIMAHIAKLIEISKVEVQQDKKSKEYVAQVSLMLNDLLAYKERKSKYFWYIYVLAIDYSIGNILNQDVLNKVVALLTENLKGDWQVCYICLSAVNSVIIEDYKLDMTQIYNTITDMATDNSVDWRLRDKIAMICKSTNLYNNTKLERVYLEMLMKETNPKVKQTLNTE